MPETIENVAIKVSVNGKPRSLNVEPRMLLVEFLREQLDLTGTHVGCDTTYCGACTVSYSLFRLMARRSRRLRDWKALANFIPFRRPSATLTACSADIARPA